ncbi:glycine cleavage system protein H [Limosilactobacillus mucosae]|uniref:glycine cleavage system protein H n=1 Tax=Limosilactobacillus mucosae TaxID=97478 RepID=UPI003994E72D
MEQPWWIDHQARDLVAVGLNEPARRELGKLLFVDVALVGTRLKTNDSLATIEGQKMIIDFKSPLDGVIVAVNPELEGWVAADSDNSQWLIKVQPFS